jgi:CheY-like chemotaxis protein/RNA polymerase subunit RPABC4/transcription elongation factor Spt4
VACAAPYEPDPRLLTALGLTAEDLADAKPTRGRGCGDCGDTGYRGRTGVFEIMPVTPAMRGALTRDPSEGALAAAARRSGVMTLRAAAVRKAMAGVTTFEEVLRVTHSENLGGHACPACARRLADDMVVCPWCNVSVSRGHCTGCARPLNADWKVCPWCRAPAHPVPEQSTSSAEEPNPPRVLVVDDDRDVCESVRALLAGVADVDAVSTAGEVLNLVADREYDVAIIAEGLPDLSAVELIRRLRSELRTTLLPLLFLTGRGAEELEGSARHAGADDVLPKPLDVDTLKARVLALARRSPRTITANARLLSS